MSSGSSTRTSRRGLSRKIRALLAGGLVLGVGAVATLAAWNDSEYATGTFTAGTFVFEGSTTSATAGFSEHATPGAAAPLTFTSNFDNLSPGTTVYAPFWVRLGANTTTPATVDLVGVTSTGTNAANITFQVYAIAPAATCGTGVSTTTSMVGATALPLTTNAAIPGATPALTIGSPVTTPGTAVQMCFVVTAGAGLAQGGSVTSTWQFTATSTS